MQHTHAKMASVNKHLDAYAPGKPVSRELARDDRLTLEGAYAELAALTERLQIRFGSEHELVAVHNGAGSTALEVVYYADLIESAADAAAVVDEHRQAIDRAVLEFGLARQSFTLVAYRVVGVRLPAVQLSEV